jgi:hypothetical protein
MLVLVGLQACCGSRPEAAPRGAATIRIAVQNPKAPSSDHYEGPGFSAQAVEQTSTFGCSRNYPVAAAEVIFDNRTDGYLTFELTDVTLLQARCPEQSPHCTVGDLWDLVRTRRSDVIAKAEQTALEWAPPYLEGSAPEPLGAGANLAIRVPPGRHQVRWSVTPVWPAHTPHWLKLELRTDSIEFQLVATLWGKEVFCDPQR